jgi:hypothetical protein
MAGVLVAFTGVALGAYALGIGGTSALFLVACATFAAAVVAALLFEDVLACCGLKPRRTGRSVPSFAFS